ncbi:ShlB/FhaC/HecB family hemolysin secretion/activation protein [Nodosilinea sp. LEGE 07298]|uniref:ShlB/FhaC/HecB family hemolysin secretion/activation protein n=1 Tax=Nodosilinea sp. LEGE 07298 TaxID=2777970 RepID=UPI001881D6E2|nr:ShlB/FhaC/HecB family hemolysin secretion/activation protein [Nodosilinea sp. LEGE 07298]MBE9108666.1 ShlB/FhaC/HecB family hemolysin secretion/activation protein [Nodosilinea sp. LEGE 07298]
MIDHSRSPYPAPQLLSQANPELPRLPNQPIPETPLPDQPLPPLPPLEELLPSVEPQPPESPLEGTDTTFFVGNIDITGSTVFSQADFADLVAPYLNRQVSFSELLDLRSAITERYIAAGYVTSGAIIPPQTLVDDTVTVQVIEGELEDIVVAGLNRLNPAYVRSRIGLASNPPLNIDRLLAGLQRLQLNPLIETVVADLQAGSRPNASILVVNVAEADSFAVDVSLDNYGFPSVGAGQRRLLLSEGNLAGWGDRIALEYENTDGSNEIDASYTLPVSPNNDALRFRAGYSNSRVIDPNFDVLDISSDSFYYEFGYRHFLIETPTEELTLGLTLSHQRNQTFLGLDNIGPFPLSPGADSQGITQVTALRFSQEWSQRSQHHVLAFRSQFSFGLDLLNATLNDTGPDSRFLAWRGQGQWLQRLGADTVLLLRGDAQLTTDDLLSQEKFGLGGALSVRGYRQDALLRDNGMLLSAELRSPIARIPELDGTLQLIPFLDAGLAWDAHTNSPSAPNTLISTGLGLLWQQGDSLSMRLDLGIPLVPLAEERNGLQESGLYVSVRYMLF